MFLYIDIEHRLLAFTDFESVDVGHSQSFSPEPEIGTLQYYKSL